MHKKPQNYTSSVIGAVIALTGQAVLAQPVSSISVGSTKSESLQGLATTSDRQSVDTIGLMSSPVVLPLTEKMDIAGQDVIVVIEDRSALISQRPSAFASRGSGYTLDNKRVVGRLIYCIAGRKGGWGPQAGSSTQLAIAASFRSALDRSIGGNTNRYRLEYVGGCGKDEDRADGFGESAINISRTNFAIILTSAISGNTQSEIDGKSYVVLHKITADVYNSFYSKISNLLDEFANSQLKSKYYMNAINPTGTPDYAAIYLPSRYYNALSYSYFGSERIEEVAPGSICHLPHNDEAEKFSIEGLSQSVRQILPIDGNLIATTTSEVSDADEVFNRLTGNYVIPQAITSEYVAEWKRRRCSIFIGSYSEILSVYNKADKKTKGRILTFAESSSHDVRKIAAISYGFPSYEALLFARSIGGNKDQFAALAGYGVGDPETFRATVNEMKMSGYSRDENLETILQYLSDKNAAIPQQAGYRNAVEVQASRLTATQATALRQQRDVAERQRDAAAREAERWRTHPYLAVITCGIYGWENLNAFTCFSGRNGVDTEIEIKNGSAYNFYSLHEIVQNFRPTSRGIEIPLRSLYAIKIQNAQDDVKLGLRIFDKSGNVVYQKQVSKYGIISTQRSQ